MRKDAIGQEASDGRCITRASLPQTSRNCNALRTAPCLSNVFQILHSVLKSTLSVSEKKPKAATEFPDKMIPSCHHRTKLPSRACAACARSHHGITDTSTFSLASPLERASTFPTPHFHSAQMLSRKALQQSWHRSSNIPKALSSLICAAEPPSAS